MTSDLSALSHEELKKLLHTENFRFSNGLEQGLPFEMLKDIRTKIRLITAELEKRNLVGFAKAAGQFN